MLKEVELRATCPVHDQLMKDSPHIRENLKARTRRLVYGIKTGKITESSEAALIHGESLGRWKRGTRGNALLVLPLQPLILYLVERVVLKRDGCPVHRTSGLPTFEAAVY